MDDIVQDERAATVEMQAWMECCLEAASADERYDRFSEGARLSNDLLARRQAELARLAAEEIATACCTMPPAGFLPTAPPRSILPSTASSAAHWEPRPHGQRPKGVSPCVLSKSTI
jgi:hypothetical protein